MAITLYYGSGSPYAWRVQLALEAKGLPYERIEPIAPHKPFVPVHAPGALMLPIVEIRTPSSPTVASSRVGAPVGSTGAA